MRRWEFITVLGGAGVALPLGVHAQLQPMPVIGFLGSGSYDTYVDLLPAFRRGLNEAGYVEGKSVAIEFRWGDGGYDRLSALAMGFVNRPVAVIAAASLPAALAAKAATSQIPVVFASGGDPVSDGLVASLNRPGGNVTGVTNFFGQLGVKRLELLREMIPAISIIAVLINPNNANAHARLAEVQKAARAMGQKIQVFNASTASEIDTAFTNLVRQGAGALLVGDDPIFITQRLRIVALAAQHSLPAIYYIRRFADAGGLMSYGISFSDSYLQFGLYVGRVLKGARPSDLPVMQPTKFEFVINLKTATALGLTVPGTLLARADEVIE